MYRLEVWVAVKFCDYSILRGVVQYALTSGNCVVNSHVTLR